MIWAVDRDPVPFGGRSPDFRRPNGVRLASSVVINLEEGVEPHVGDGDAVSERMGKVISVMAPGQPTGRRCMLAGLDRYPPPATLLRCGQTIPQSPSLAAAAARHAASLDACFARKD